VGAGGPMAVPAAASRSCAAERAPRRGHAGIAVLAPPRYGGVLGLGSEAGPQPFFAMLMQQKSRGKVVAAQRAGLFPVASRRGR
jgi:hypothetical protein